MRVEALLRLRTATFHYAIAAGGGVHRPVQVPGHPACAVERSPDRPDVAMRQRRRVALTRYWLVYPERVEGHDRNLPVTAFPSGYLEAAASGLRVCCRTTAHRTLRRRVHGLMRLFRHVCQ